MSQIDIYCPHCTQKLGMNREKFYASLGKKTQCPTCHKYMTLSQDLFHTFRDTSKKEKREPEIEKQPRKENALDPNLGTTLKEYLETIWGPTGTDTFEAILGLVGLVGLVAGVCVVGSILIKSMKPHLGSPRETVVTIESCPSAVQSSGYQSRPDRPAQAILGQWKFFNTNGNYAGEKYFKPGPAGRVTLTGVTKNGEIYNKEFVLQNENIKTGYVELKRYFRRELGETKGESGTIFSIQPVRHQFSNDSMSVVRENYWFEEWYSGERLEFVSNRQSP